MRPNIHAMIGRLTVLKRENAALPSFLCPSIRGKYGGRGFGRLPALWLKRNPIIDGRPCRDRQAQNRDQNEDRQSDATHVLACSSSPPLHAKAESTVCTRLNVSDSSSLCHSIEDLFGPDSERYLDRTANPKWPVRVVPVEHRPAMKRVPDLVL